MAKARRRRTKQLKQIQMLTGLLLLVVIGFVGGWSVALTSNNKSKSPHNLVWAVDESVNLPNELRTTLEQQDLCQNYKGPGTSKGVGLWAVQQISKDSFAKVVHGCSWSLDNYVMVVKMNGDWQVIKAEDYFAPGQGQSGRSSLPKCTQIEMYKIDQSIEPFCLDAKSVAKTNTIK